MKAFTQHTRKLLAMGVCLLPAAAFAADNTGSDDLSYGWVEADYINLDVDSPNENDVFDGDFDNGGGWGISASIPLGERFFLFGDYSETDADFSFVNDQNLVVPGNGDFLRLNLGVGVAMPMSDSTDFVLSGAYSDIDYDSFRLGARDNDLDDIDEIDDAFRDLNDDPSDGFMVDARIRSQLTQMLEGSVGVRYTDIQDNDNFSIVGNLLWEFNDNWGVNLLVDAGDDLVTWGAGVRFSF